MALENRERERERESDVLCCRRREDAICDSQESEPDDGDECDSGDVEEK